MIKSIAWKVMAAFIVFSFVESPNAEAQYATIIETTTQERKIPPPPEVRGYEHRANNPYFGLRSSYPSIRQYYSNPNKTIPKRTTRTIIVPYRGRYPYYGYPYSVSPYQVYPQYQYGYTWGFRRR